MYDLGKIIYILEKYYEMFRLNAQASVQCINKDIFPALEPMSLCYVLKISSISSV